MHQYYIQFNIQIIVGKKKFYMIIVLLWKLAWTCILCFNMIT